MGVLRLALDILDMFDIELEFSKEIYRSTTKDKFDIYLEVVFSTNTTVHEIQLASRHQYHPQDISFHDKKGLLAGDYAMHENELAKQEQRENEEKRRGEDMLLHRRAEEICSAANYLIYDSKKFPKMSL